MDGLLFDSEIVQVVGKIKSVTGECPATLAIIGFWCRLPSWVLGEVLIEKPLTGRNWLKIILVVPNSVNS